MLIPDSDVQLFCWGQLKLLRDQESYVTEESRVVWIVAQMLIVWEGDVVARRDGFQESYERLVI